MTDFTSFASSSAEQVDSSLFLLLRDPNQFENERGDELEADSVDSELERRGKESRLLGRVVGETPSAEEEEEAEIAGARTGKIIVV